MIIKLINNINGPLRLPEWTPTLVIILLAIGFPLVIIFSWIYDIHPEGGMVKTKPAAQVIKQDEPKSSNGWKIASYISFVAIIGLIVLNIIPRGDRNRRVRSSINPLRYSLSSTTAKTRKMSISSTGSWMNCSSTCKPSRN